MRQYDFTAIAARYVAGQNAPEISAEVGCSTETVYRAIRSVGVAFRHPRGPKPARAVTKPRPNPDHRLTRWPAAAPARFPYLDHRDQSETARYEALGCYCDLPHVHGHKTDCPVWKQMVGKPLGRGG